MGVCPRGWVSPARRPPPPTPPHAPPARLRAPGWGERAAVAAPSDALVHCACVCVVVCVLGCVCAGGSGARNTKKKLQKTPPPARPPTPKRAHARPPYPPVRFISHWACLTSTTRSMAGRGVGVCVEVGRRGCGAAERRPPPTAPPPPSWRGIYCPLCTHPPHLHVPAGGVGGGGRGAGRDRAGRGECVQADGGGRAPLGLANNRGGPAVPPGQ